jgi:hypothetical protein
MIGERRKAVKSAFLDMPDSAAPGFLYLFKFSAQNSVLKNVLEKIEQDEYYSGSLPT